MSPGLIIAAPSSGSGKTLFTLALLRAFKRAGIAAASAKVGPDYIDPGFHSAASGRPCLNLDPWAMRAATLAAAIDRLGAAAEIVVCEGVMGLFDGATAAAGSTADLAALTGWPVLLVIDVRAQAASAAAVVRGFASHRPDVTVAAVVLNRVAGARHADVISEACRAALPELPILGALPRQDDLIVPERHLGLVQAYEHADLDGFFERAAAVLAAHVDIAAVRALARPARPHRRAAAAPPIPPPGQRIAVATNVAFAFTYPLTLAGWRDGGAEILPFSPLADEAPDAHADAVFLPGGYPELHAGRLAGNHRFLAGLRRTAARGAAVWGECGGYMVLGEGLIDADGHRHVMAGLLGLETTFAARRLHLGYRRATLARATPFGRAGSRFRGHEFHYAAIVREDGGAPLFAIADASGQPLGHAGLMRGAVFGSFIHLIDGDDDQQHC